MRLLHIFLILLLAITPVFPCTVFNAHYGNTVMAGNNEDWIDQDAWIWFLPGGSGRYGMVLTGFENAYAQGGMNEKGLFFDWFAGFGSQRAPTDPNKKNISGNAGAEILRIYETVDEALKFFDTYNAPDLGYAQLMLADRFGASAAVRWNWAEDKMLIERPDTNYHAIGVGKYYLDDIFSADATTITPERFRSLAESTKQSSYTVYSSIYDLVSGQIYLYYHQDYAVQKQWNIHTELQKGAHFYSMRKLFPVEAKNTSATPIMKILQNSFGPTLGLFLFAVLVMLIVLFGIGLVFWILFVIRKRVIDVARSLTSMDRILPIIAIVISALCCIIFLLLLILLLKFPIFGYFYGFGIISPILIVMPVFMIVLTILHILASVMIWIRRYWGILTRIVYTLLALFSSFCVYFLILHV